MKYLVLFILLASLYSCDRRKPLQTGLEGQPLPALDILSYDSITHLNTSHAPDGKPVVLFYFNPHCPYCRAEMANIIDNISSLRNIRFFILTNSPFTQMKGFYDHYELGKYPNLSVGIDLDNSFSKQFNVFGVPYTAIYHRDKTLAHAYIGRMSGRQIKDVAEN